MHITSNLVSYTQSLYFFSTMPIAYFQYMILILHGQDMCLHKRVTAYFLNGNILFGESLSAVQRCDLCGEVNEIFLQSCSCLRKGSQLVNLIVLYLFSAILQFIFNSIFICSSYLPVKKETNSLISDKSTQLKNNETKIGK